LLSVSRENVRSWKVSAPYWHLWKGSVWSKSWLSWIFALIAYLRSTILCLINIRYESVLKRSEPWLHWLHFVSFRLSLFWTFESLQINVFKTFDLCWHVRSMGAITSLRRSNEWIDVPVWIIVKEIIDFFRVDSIEFRVCSFESFVSFAFAFDSIHVVLFQLLFSVMSFIYSIIILNSLYLIIIWSLIRI